MKDKYRKYLSSAFNLAIYFSSGVLAPLFFKNIADRKTAGVYAGGLFMITALRAVRLALTRPYLLWIRFFFVYTFLVELIFWGWRITDSRPLAEVSVLGIGGSTFHMAMTTLYSVSCGVILYSEISWLRKN